MRTWKAHCGQWDLRDLQRTQVHTAETIWSVHPHHCCNLSDHQVTHLGVSTPQSKPSDHTCIWRDLSHVLVPGCTPSGWNERRSFGSSHGVQQRKGRSAFSFPTEGNVQGGGGSPPRQYQGINNKRDQMSKSPQTTSVPPRVLSPERLPKPLSQTRTHLICFPWPRLHSSEFLLVPSLPHSLGEVLHYQNTLCDSLVSSQTPSPCVVWLCLKLPLTQSTPGLSRGSCCVEKEKTRDLTRSGEGKWENIPLHALGRHMGCVGHHMSPWEPCGTMRL